MRLLYLMRRRVDAENIYSFEHCAPSEGADAAAELKNPARGPPKQRYCLGDHGGDAEIIHDASSEAAPVTFLEIERVGLTRITVHDRPAVN